MSTRYTFPRPICIAALLVLGLFAMPLHAQDAAPDTSAWDISANGKLNFSQAGFQNWQEGGVNTLALTSGITGIASREWTQWSQKVDARFAYGIVKQDEIELRKAEDLIQIQTQLQYKGEGTLAFIRPTAAAGLRTQFAPGYNFDADPIDGTRTPPVKVSDLFAPATLTQTLGFTYVPNDWITQRLGIAAKETVVTIDRLRTLYGVDADKSVRFELGIEAFTEVNREIFENVTYQSKLGLFAAFNQVDSPDLIWENLIVMKVNTWLNMNFEFVTIYDNDVSDDLQLKEVFSAGIAFKLL